MRRFNVTGLCMPEEDYMVDISGKIAQIRKLVDDRCYFTINRARQYGKTTTLAQLKNVLMDDYIVASISFEGIGDAFESAATFCAMFVKLLREAINDQISQSGVSETDRGNWTDRDETDFLKLRDYITEICKDAESTPPNKKIVLLIDEVDKTSSNRVFLHFLGLLRDKFLARKSRKDYTFHSVILAGVYDIRNLKLKMINEGAYTPAATEGKLLNSPWNIAVDFNVDMSFNPAEIATMLREYEADHGTGMDIGAISEEIHSYTSGYPYLVSRICQCIDEKLDGNWTIAGVQEAVSCILDENSTLFDDVVKNIESNSELRDFLYNLLLVGEEYTFNNDSQIIRLGIMYGFLAKGEYRKVKIANRIFEIRICNYFLSCNELTKKRITGVLYRDVVNDGRFDMELCLRKFAQHYAEIYNELDARFIEREGRLLFLSYLRPLINGQGFYHMESEFTDLRRMDIVVDFADQQFIIELKLWKGEAAHEKAHEQIAGYLESRGAATGYLLTFDFRKGETKQPRAEWVEHSGKRIFDVVV